VGGGHQRRAQQRTDARAPGRAERHADHDRAQRSPDVGQLGEQAALAGQRSLEHAQQHQPEQDHEHAAHPLEAVLHRVERRSGQPGGDAQPGEHHREPGHEQQGRGDGPTRSPLLGRLAADHPQVGRHQRDHARRQERRDPRPEQRHHVGQRDARHQPKVKA
jgi:hypothetical protein